MENLSKNEKTKKQIYNFTKKQIYKFTKKQLKYSVGRESASSVVARTLTAVIVSHSLALRTLSAVVVLHPIVSRTLSAVLILSQIAEVVCRPLEYFRSCSKYSVARHSIPSFSFVYSIGRESTPSCSIAYFIGRHDTCAERGSILSAVRVLPLIEIIFAALGAAIQVRKCHKSA